MTVSRRRVGLVTSRVSSSKVDLGRKQKVKKDDGISKNLVPLGVAIWNIGNGSFIWNDLF